MTTSVRHKKGQQGMSMVEAMVGVLILSVVSAAVITMVLSVMSLTNSNRLKNLAIVSAEDMLEKTRDYFQINGWAKLSDYGKNPPRCFTSLWSEPYPSNGQTCENDRTNPSGPSCNLTETAMSGVPNFYRYMILTTSGTSSVTVMSVVTWKDKSICRKAQVDTVFYNY